MYSVKKTVAAIISSLVLASSLIFQPTFVTKAKTEDKNNGDWNNPRVTKWNTDEAELMVRFGDIDNFGLPWGNVDPFSGEETAVHGYPYKPESDDPDGTDRIMVVSGFKGSGYATDAYTDSTYGQWGYDTQVRPVTLTYDLKGIQVHNAYIQMFIDDIQPSKFEIVNGKEENRGRDGYSRNSRNVYQVTLSYKKNGKTISERIPSFETVVNNLDQHGPIGKLITFTVPDQYLDYIRYGGSGLSIKIDDPVNPTGDGYAIDFVKLLVNKKDAYTVNNGTVKGGVYEAKYVGNQLVLDKSRPVIGAKVTISGVKDPITTNNKGEYISDKVPAGQVVVTAEKEGYASRSVTIPTLLAKGVITQDIGIVNLAPPVMPVISVNTEAPTNQDVSVTITYPEGHVDKMYRKDGGEWKAYTGTFTVSENCKIEAQSTEKRKVGDTETVELKSGIAEKSISNIDKIPPTGRVIIDDSDATKPVLKLILDPGCEDSEIILPGSTVVYDNNTYTVNGTDITLSGIKAATISSDGKEVTCYVDFGYTFRFKDRAGNIGTAYGESNLPWKVPVKDR